MAARGFRSKSRNTPFEGWELAGRATAVAGGRPAGARGSAGDADAAGGVLMGKTEATGDAVLALADGTVFRGRAFGAVGEASGEVVFNTSMTGYQEILTDPSYDGQLVAMTYPEIGNVGVNREDVESRRPFVRGFIVREYWRGAVAAGAREQSLGDYLARAASPASRASTRARWSAICATTARRTASSRASTSTPTGWCARRARRPGMVGRDLVTRRHLRASRTTGSEGPWTLERRATADELDGAGRQPLQGRRLRLRHQVQHPAQPGAAPAARCASCPRRRRRATCWR